MLEIISSDEKDKNLSNESRQKKRTEDPQQWLAYVIRNMPYTEEKDLKSLLPQNWVPTNNTKSAYLPVNYQG